MTLCHIVRYLRHCEEFSGCADMLCPCWFRPLGNARELDRCALARYVYALLLVRVGVDDIAESCADFQRKGRHCLVTPSRVQIGPKQSSPRRYLAECGMYDLEDVESMT